MANKKKIVQGVEFDAETPQRVIDLLLYYMNSMPKQRIRVFYGDTKTGKDWGEEYDTMGYVGRSGGQVKIPLLVNNSRSWGGGSILDGRIVRITVNRKDVYRHPKYHCVTKIRKNTKSTTHPYEVMVNDDEVPHAAFRTLEKAQKWSAFIKGDSNIKG